MSGHPIIDRLAVAPVSSPAERLAGLFDTHHDRLYRLARRLVDTADDALDLVQETFLRIARSPGSVPMGAANEEAWLVRVLINIRRDQWRKAGVRKRQERPHLTSASPEAALIARNLVWEALKTLPPRRRAIIVMYELEGLAIPEIGSLLGISSITVRWHLAAGRRELARALKSHMEGSHENH